MKKAFLLKKTKKKVGKDVHVKGYVCGSCDSGGARTRPAATTRRGTTSSGQGTTRAGITSFRYMD